MRVALILLLLLAPLALADHVYSHRVVVAGRVVDASGMPVPSLPVQVRFAGLAQGDGTTACFDAPSDRTGPQGDFTLCRHAHVVPRGVRVNVTAGNASMEADLDPDLRRVSFHLRLPEASPARDIEGERLFARAFRVEGRVMQHSPTPTAVEGVNVTSLPVGGVPVNVTLANDGRILAAGNATTNEHGDYALDLPAGEIPLGTRVHVRVPGDQRSDPASATFRRADVEFVVGRASETLIPERPGTRTPDIPLPWPLVALALGVAALAMRRR